MNDLKENSIPIIEDEKSIISLKEQELKERKKVTESLKRKRLKEVERQKRTIKKTIKYSISFLLLAITLLKIERHYNPVNIYKNNRLIINDDEKDKLYKLISQETGASIVENERLLVLNAVIENKKLTEEEKKVLYEFDDLLLEDPYLNKESAYKSLRKVKVINKSTNNLNIEGKYTFPDNKITMYLKESQSDYEATLIHEFIHCIYFTKKTYELPQYFREGMTELLTNEYFTSTPYYEHTSYPFEIIVVKQLCNMIGSDKVLEAFSKGDMNLIAQELSRTMSEEESSQFLEDMDKTFYHYEKDHSLEDKDYYIGMRNFFLNFDKKRYADSLENNTYEELWKDKLEESSYNIDILMLLDSKTPYNEYLWYVEENGVYLRPLFSKKLKETSEEPHLDKSYARKYFVCD